MSIKPFFKILFLLAMTFICFSKASAENPDRISTGFEILDDTQKDLRIDFQGQKKSLIDFEKMNVGKWLSYDLWEEKVALQEASPYWEALLRTKRQNEQFGRVLACHGRCIVSKGEAENLLQYRSKIVEGDEARTDDKSYVWLFLFDGTLIRLAPNSSISLNEINISEKTMFFNIRLNQGNMYLLSRSRYPVKSQKRRETDQVFFPLELYEANPKSQRGSISLEDYLFSGADAVVEQYDRVNYYQDFNNQFVNKNSFYFISMPNATIFGQNFSLEAYAAIAGDSYFKKRNYDFHARDNNFASFNLRGYARKEEVTMVNDTWYKVSLPAKTYEEIEPLKPLRINEFLTKRIPSILLARELYLQRFSRALFSEDVTKEVLAKKFGYRLWTEEEHLARTKFLIDFTRRLETSNLAVAKRYREKVLEKSSLKDARALRPEYYKYAVYKYISSGEKNREVFFIPRYNSEKRELWKYFNGIR